MLMSPVLRKFIAVLLAVWLPLFSGSVLAASVSMQLHNGHNSHAAVPDHDDLTELGGSCEQHSVAKMQAHDHHDKSCAACGVCNLACSGYLTVSDLVPVTMQQTGASGFSYLLSFVSITSIPLLPPPLSA